MFCLICNDVGIANGGAVGGMREWLDSKTVENGGWAGESLCHGVGLKALGAGDGSLYYYPSKPTLNRVPRHRDL